MIIACGAVCTPQILRNSPIDVPQALGRYACEQSIAFCQVCASLFLIHDHAVMAHNLPQIVLSSEIIQSIKDTTDPEWQRRIKRHYDQHPLDPLPIPFDDPEPQVMVSPCSPAQPWHCQIHRDAFSYGDVGPRADARTVVDLRFFGRQDVNPDNRVDFAPRLQSNSETDSDSGPTSNPVNAWVAGVTDIYGMPQATVRTSTDAPGGT